MGTDLEEDNNYRTRGLEELTTKTARGPEESNNKVAL
jgi:hypothetical protein